MRAGRKEGPGKFAVAIVQMAMGTDPRANVEKGVDRVREAARGGAQVVCLPELFRTRYFCQTEETAFFDLAEPLPGPTTDRPLRGGAGCRRRRDRTGLRAARPGGVP